MISYLKRRGIWIAAAVTLVTVGCAFPGLGGAAMAFFAGIGLRSLADKYDHHSDDDGDDE